MIQILGYKITLTGLSIYLVSNILSWPMWMQLQNVRVGVANSGPLRCLN